MSLGKGGIVSLLIVFCFVCVQLLSLAPAAKAQSLESMSGEELFELSLEELLNTEVVTAGRKAQKISEAPATITVIPAKDLKESGATQLNEALGMVPGLHLGYTTSNFMAAGGIRGFNKLPSNKIVLLVDGLPWSFEVYGIPMFPILPVSLDEIDRIEVLRGAGSSLYGANAVFGVINVITKKTEDTKGNLLSLSGGEFGTYIGNYIHGATLSKNLNYRLSLGWEQRDNWDYVAFATDPIQKQGRINTVFDYSINDNSNLNLTLGYIDIKDLFASMETTGPLDFGESKIYSGSLAYTSEEPNLTVRTFFSEKDMWDRGFVMGVRNTYFKMGTRGLEFQHSLEPFEKDSLVWGANYNQEYVDGPSIGGKHKHNLYGAFIDNTYGLLDNLDLNTGLRYDRHPNTGSSLSHRLVFIWQPHEDHTLRLNWASAFRNPDFIESYYSAYSPIGGGIFAHVFGQKDNDPEKSTQFELAYTGQLSKKCIVGLNVFYTRIEDFILFVQNGLPAFDAAISGIAVPMPFMNIGDAKQYGAEAELKYQFTDYLTGEINYTLLEQWENNNAAVTQLLTMTPQHMVNAQLKTRFKNGWTGNLSVHYRSASTWRNYIWAAPQGSTIVGGNADSYLIANLRIGYIFELAGNEAEIGLAISNLTDKKYDDYPINTSDVRRRAMGTFTYKF